MEVLWLVLKESSIVIHVMAIVLYTIKALSHIFTSFILTWFLEDNYSDWCEINLKVILLFHFSWRRMLIEYCSKYLLVISAFFFSELYVLCISPLWIDRLFLRFCFYNTLNMLDFNSLLFSMLIIPFVVHNS